MMLVPFAAQLVDPPAAGAAIAKFGYSAVLGYAAGLVPAVAFRALPAGHAVAAGGAAEPALMEAPVRDSGRE